MKEYHPRTKVKLTCGIARRFVQPKQAPSKEEIVRCSPLEVWSPTHFCVNLLELLALNDLNYVEVHSVLQKTTLLTCSVMKMKKSIEMCLWPYFWKGWRAGGQWTGLKGQTLLLPSTNRTNDTSGVDFPACTCKFLASMDISSYEMWRFIFLWSRLLLCSFL